MKTKNSVQKTILRSGAVIVSFVLISLTVSAQDFWKKLLVNSSFNEIALAMTETSKNAKVPAGSDAKTSAIILYQEEVEKPLQVEEWMTDESHFSNSIFNYETEQESKLDLENWMLNENLFENSLESEPELKVENWMTSDKIWNS
jgi:hypothetical protein